MNIVCLVIDRLHAGYIGAYGNAWIETPSIDRLASEGFLFDQMLIDSPKLDSLYRAYWQGRHAMCTKIDAAEQSTLADGLREAGMRTLLMTDSPEVAGHPLADCFDETVRIDPPWETSVAEEIDETHFARCFAQIVDQLAEAEQPFMLWCHLAGLGTTWDAPMEFRRRYWEDGDPEPPLSASVPELMLEDNFDPDELLPMTQAYAGQVSLLDICIGGLAEFIENGPLEDTLFVLTSPRGFPLGEHRRVGPVDNSLHGELVHVPLIFRLPNLQGATARSQALVEPADLCATLLGFCGEEQDPDSPTAASLLPLISDNIEVLRDRLCIFGEGDERAIRTPAWYLRMSDPPELYAKPDDRWEVNNVADRCPDVVEKLSEAFSEYTKAITSGSSGELPPLDDLLLEGLE